MPLLVALEVLWFYPSLALLKIMIMKMLSIKELQEEGKWDGPFLPFCVLSHSLYTFFFLQWVSYCVLGHTVYEDVRLYLCMYLYVCECREVYMDWWMGFWRFLFNVCFAELLHNVQVGQLWVDLSHSLSMLMYLLAYMLSIYRYYSRACIYIGNVGTIHEQLYTKLTCTNLNENTISYM